MAVGFGFCFKVSYSLLRFILLTTLVARVKHTLHFRLPSFKFRLLISLEMPLISVLLLPARNNFTSGSRMVWRSVTTATT